MFWMQRRAIEVSVRANDLKLLFGFPGRPLGVSTHEFLETARALGLHWRAADGTMERH